MTLIVVCGLALLAVPCASAADKDAASSSTANFKAMDTDSDGRISPDEFAAGNQQKLDANYDGLVSDEEKAAAKPAKKHWWSRSSDSPSQDPAAGSKTANARK